MSAPTMRRTHELSDHAKKRRKEMGVTEREIQEAIDDPAATYPADVHASHKGSTSRTAYRTDRLVVVVSDAHRIVITVMWAWEFERANYDDVSRARP